MSVYKLATAPYGVVDENGVFVETATEKDLGWLLTEFEPFQPNPQYSWKTRRPARRDQWPTVVPVHGPAVVNTLEDIMYKMMDISWRFSEPEAGVLRGMAGGHNYNPMVIGTHGMPQSLAKVFVPPQGYHPQVRPTGTNLPVMMTDKSAIARDWHLHEGLERTNAVTFRADKRPPYKILVEAPPPPWQPGFNPPISRALSKEPYYLANGIYSAFKGYMKRRYQRDIGDSATFVAAVNKELVTPQAKELLYEYLVWLSITKKESAHLGRMVENEALKEWISTARCLDASLVFANMGGTPGWMYVVIVHSGYVVPFAAREELEWGTAETEIAQFGSIPADRIVGFARFSYTGPDTPIFIRKSFRKDEPKACDRIFDALSGAPST